MSRPDTFRYFCTEPKNVESKCIFCKIGDGRIKPGNRNDPAELLFENDRLVAFDDIQPGARRHFLVVTKSHLKNCWSLTAEILDEMDEVATKLIGDYRTDGEETRKFFIRPPFNSVYHVHLHVMLGELTDPIWQLRKIGYQSPLFHITPEQLVKESDWAKEPEADAPTNP